VATELVLFGTAGAPLPVAGRRGTASALVVDGRVFVIDCGRGAPCAFADAGLDFRHLDAVFLTHLHADHTGDLPGMLLYGWGVRANGDRTFPPIRVYGPSRPKMLPSDTDGFARQTTICPQLPAPGTTDLVGHILAGYAYHLNVMPLDARMPDPGALVNAADVAVRPRTANAGAVPIVVCEDGGVRVTAVAVAHGHAIPALAYRFDTPDGSIAFSGDTTVNDDLISLARGADILVHQVADLSYLARHGYAGADLDRMEALHTDVTQVGAVAQRAHVGELILNHYLPAEPGAITEADWARRAGQGFAGTTTAGRDGLRRTLVKRALSGRRPTVPSTWPVSRPRSKIENRGHDHRSARTCRTTACSRVRSTCTDGPHSRLVRPEGAHRNRRPTRGLPWNTS
jgi:ribonuclease BN (tRNA processing enzyme)